MSGRKDYPITITSSQWESMRQSVTAAESKAINAEQSARRAEMEAQSKIQDLLERASLDVSGLNQALQAQAQNHTVALERAETDFQRRLEQQGYSFHEALRRQCAEFERELVASHEVLQSQISDIIQRMEAERQSKTQIASYWVNQAQSLVNELNSKYQRHRLFLPGELDKLKMRLRYAQDDIGRQDEAALVTARELCFQAIELRERVIICEWEWTRLYNYAKSRLIESKNEIDGLETLEYSEQVEGKMIQTPAKVDFWTRGALTEAKTEQQRLERIIRDDIDNLSSDDVRSIIEQISSLKNRISAIDETARNAYCASQVRREIGSEMIERLPGWNLEEVLFEGEDERENLHLVFRHIDGVDRLSLIVRGGNQEETNVTADYFCESAHGDRHDAYVRQVNQAIHAVDPSAQQRTALRYEGRTSGDRSVLSVDEIKRRKRQ